MNQTTNALAIDLAAVLERLPSLAAALAEGKLAAEIVLQGMPEGDKEEARRRLEAIEKGIEEAKALTAYMQWASDKK